MVAVWRRWAAPVALIVDGTPSRHTVKAHPYGTPMHGLLWLCFFVRRGWRCVVQLRPISQKLPAFMKPHAHDVASCHNLYYPFKLTLQKRANHLRMERHLQTCLSAGFQAQLHHRRPCGQIQVPPPRERQLHHLHHILQACLMYPLCSMLPFRFAAAFSEASLARGTPSA